MRQMFISDEMTPSAGRVSSKSIAIEPIVLEFLCKRLLYQLCSIYHTKSRREFGLILVPIALVESDGPPIHSWTFRRPSLIHSAGSDSSGVISDWTRR
jgi:hypothetical protein